MQLPLAYGPRRLPRHCRTCTQRDQLLARFDGRRLGVPLARVQPQRLEEAIEAFGPEDAVVVLAAILQRSSLINSAGGYLRNLTKKARAGAFSLGPMLMALIRANLQKGSQKMRA